MRILVTGGTGYIGSHTCVELLDAGYEVVVVDNLCNSKVSVVDRIEGITGKRPVFFQADLRDGHALNDIFRTHHFAAVIHFAGLKAVGESVTIPLEYYRNNLDSTLTLCEAMKRHGVRNIVFSSSATVYSDAAAVPIREDAPTEPSSPYGRTKWMIEQILSDLHASDRSWNVILLRYFNPVGAHASGKIGEAPLGIPNNLVPYITQVAAGNLTELRVFGNDYDTVDGTGVRDYIHVVDLAQGHRKALEKLSSGAGLQVFNLGTGRGFSVLQMIAAFERVIGKPIPFRIDARRAGDIATSYADPSRAHEVLGWKALRGIDEMVRDAWNWQIINPDGYD